jgi:hypothetical protein
MVKKILIILIAWRTITLLASFLAPQFTPYVGDFPYKELVTWSKVPHFIAYFANFDGVNYLTIAKDGYQPTLTAFFPFYPLLIRIISPIFGSSLIITGLAISNISLVIFLLLINRLFKPNYWFYLLFLSFPTSFYLGSVYTESLFLLLLVLTFRLPIISLLSGLTRITGIFNAILLFFNKRRLFFIPLIGLSLYCTFLYLKFRDPFMFVHTLSNFGNQRSGSFILLPQVYYRYLKIFLIANHNFQYFIAVLEFVIFNLFALLLAYDLKTIIRNKQRNSNRLSLNLFSWSNLILPTLTGSLSSIPRYALLSISAFLFLSEYKNKYVKLALVVVFAILQLLAEIYFIQGNFIA